MECYSAIKSETMPLSATGMDLEVTILSKVGERKKSSTHHLHVESKKKKKYIYIYIYIYIYKLIYLQNRIRLTGIRNKSMVSKGERCREG